MAKVTTEKLADFEEQDAEATAQEEGLIEDTRVVRWHGQPGVDYREISAESWLSAGVSPDAQPKTVRWDKANGYTVPRSFLAGFLTDDQIRVYVEMDGRFKVEDS